MTRVNLHGILAQEYGKQFSLRLGKVTDVVRAIDCNRDGFLHRLGQLQLQGFFYDIIVDNERLRDIAPEKLRTATQIDLVPVIAGAGVIPAVIGAVGSVAGAVGGAIGAVGGAIGGAVGAIGGAFGAGGALSGIGGTIIKGVGMSLLSKALTPKPPVMEAPKPPKALDPITVIEETAGASAEAGASANSYVFGGRANLAAQGAPLPIGYGRLRIGSNVIQASVKSYPCELEPVSMMLGDPEDYKTSQEYGTNRNDGEAQVIRSISIRG
tara:strand:- start:63 stop:866 length:804 start_codon:yes stop_codon:yes gene_type:complete